MKIILWLVITILLHLSNTYANWTYPVQEVSKPSVDCKFQPWSEHSQDCKVTLPIIENANYTRYKDNMDYRLIYSVLWWATYKWGWDVWYWWHWWIDIASAQWTPLYSILDWVVETASFLAWWWNTVVIRHEHNWWYIRSVYTHMHNIQTNQWQRVSAWDRIWTIWTTGNSRGNHVHFQIDINQDWNHPWYYQNCWWSNADIVNSGECRDQLLRNTTDPIRFLETNWASLSLPTTEEEEQQLVEDTKQEEEKITQDEIETRERIMLTELELFLARYPMETRSNISANTMSVWESWTIDLSVSYRNRPFNWSLPMSLEMEYNDDIIQVSPRKLIAIQDWNREININAVSEWETRLIMKIWWKIIANYLIRVVEDWTVLNAARWIIYNLWTNYIWWENDWLVVMQDANNNNIVSVPYEWNFTLETNENLKICNPEITSRREIQSINNFECWPENWEDSISFSYNDTLEWLFIYKIRAVNTWQWIIELYKWNDRIWRSSPKNIQRPVDINFNTEYKDSILNWLKRWFIDNSRNWNFAPGFRINEQDAASWIKNTFPVARDYEGSRAKQMTRLDFMKLLNEMTSLEAQNLERQFRDIGQENRKYSNILLDYWVELDDHSHRYFQPDKWITRWEVAHILNSLRR